MNKELDTIQYMHFRPLDKALKPQSRGGYTMAYREELDEQGKPRIRYGHSVCSRFDNFCRADGRRIAKLHLELDYFAKVTSDDFATFQKKVTDNQANHGNHRVFGKQRKKKA